MSAIAHAQPRLSWTLVVEATIGLIWGRCLCSMPIARWLRLARLQAATAEAANVRHRTATDAELLAIARHLHGIARRVPWRSDCLPIALAAMRMLGRRGYRPILHLGARLARDGSDAAGKGLNAHAWVDCDGFIVSGGPVHMDYVPVSSWEIVRLPGDRT